MLLVESMWGTTSYWAMENTVQQTLRFTPHQLHYYRKYWPTYIKACFFSTLIFFLHLQHIGYHIVGQIGVLVDDYVLHECPITLVGDDLHNNYDGKQCSVGV